MDSFKSLSIATALLAGGLGSSDSYANITLQNEHLYIPSNCVLEGSSRRDYTQAFHKQRNYLLDVWFEEYDEDCDLLSSFYDKHRVFVKTKEDSVWYICKRLGMNDATAITLNYIGEKCETE